ncbi:unnamed protein product [Rhizoctonia solani]|nr:unnamed protein product [Rhizoctonia solani]
MATRYWKLAHANPEVVCTIVEATEAPEVAQHYGIRKFPSVKFIKEGLLKDGKVPEIIGYNKPALSAGIARYK